MRYLKRFNPLLSKRQSEEEFNYHSGVIKDVFQDVFDDYVIEKETYWQIPTADPDDRIIGKYYLMYMNLWNPYVELYIYDMSPSGYSMDALKNIDFSKHIKRLEFMGYEVCIMGLDTSIGLTIDYSGLINNI